MVETISQIELKTLFYRAKDFLTYTWYYFVKSYIIQRKGAGCYLFWKTKFTAPILTLKRKDGDAKVTIPHTEDDSMYHCVLVIGYQNDGDLIYMDPQTGTINVSDPNDMNYDSSECLVITGINDMIIW